MTESRSMEPAERRTTELLALVASQPPQVPEHFTRTLMRRVRAQRAAAVPLRAVAGLLAAIAGGFGAALRDHSRRSRP
jgi:hypothetical protein